MKSEFPDDSTPPQVSSPNVSSPIMNAPKVSSPETQVASGNRMVDNILESVGLKVGEGGTA